MGGKFLVSLQETSSSLVVSLILLSLLADSSARVLTLPGSTKYDEDHLRFIERSKNPSNSNNYIQNRNYPKRNFLGTKVHKHNDSRV